jgi:hypothetical protein
VILSRIFLTAIIDDKVITDEVSTDKRNRDLRGFISLWDIESWYCPQPRTLISDHATGFRDHATGPIRPPYPRTSLQYTTS